jgi:hypothetical protein
MVPPPPPMPTANISLKQADQNNQQLAEENQEQKKFDPSQNSNYGQSLFTMM